MLAPEDQYLELRRKFTNTKIHDVPHRMILLENIHALLAVGRYISAAHVPMAADKGPPVFGNQASRT